MTSKAITVEEYLAELPDDRREAIEAVRNEILKNLPEGYEEGMSHGGIGYYVPHSLYPNGYHCDPKQPVPFVGLASQKNHMAVYMFCLYCNPVLVKEFIQAYQETGKKLDMGSSCVRFKKLADFPVELIGQTIAKISVDRFLAYYEEMIPASKRKKK
jgi:uncharacterized protein YdhG (YjbR/CyaY superfamily)